MTTIAYKNGIVAYDSRSTSGARILTDNADKQTVSKGVRFFMACSVSDQKSFIEQYHGDRSVGKSFNVSAFVVDDNELFLSSSDEKELWVMPWDTKIHEAIGSGSEYAVTAMDMGASAKEAVKWAMKRDSGTGGKIRTFRIKK